MPLWLSPMIQPRTRPVLPDTRPDIRSTERQIQTKWRAAGIFEAGPVPGRPKWFVVELPPFANGKLHLGHLRNYTIGDVIARFRRMAGYNVLYTIGFDAFGLPNENAARDQGCDPENLVERNMSEMLREFERLGLSYDRRRVIADHEPRFYRWVQWVFLRLFEAGHVFRGSGAVHWCPSCRSTLAESLVEAGCCWRCKTPVSLIQTERWFVREADFVAPLLAGDDRLPGWPSAVKRMHRDWIGPRDGIEIKFPIASCDVILTAFTAQPEMLAETAFLAVGPLHPLAAGASEGRIVVLGLAANNPVSDRRLPVVLLRDDDRVLEGEVVLGCPAREPRDDAIWRSISSDPAGERGDSTDAPAIIDRLIACGAGRRTTRYRLRDWDIARPRYWGTPVPIIHCTTCGPVAVPDRELPVVLPDGVDLASAKNPLAGVSAFLHALCPRCGGAACRDTDTIETYACPWWFYLTCKDPLAESPFDRRSTEQWMPVDVVIGGADQIQTCFFHLRTLAQAMTRLGIVDELYPVKRLIVIGMVKQNGRKISKSAGNAAELGGMIDRYGADVLRLAILSSAAPDQDINWSDGLLTRASRFGAAVRKFFDRHDFDFSTLPTPPPRDTVRQRRLADWVATAERKVTGSIERFAFHVAIQQIGFLHERIEHYVREAGPDDHVALSHAARSFLRLLAPIAPHLAEELWQGAGGEGLLAAAAWPIAPGDKAAHLAPDDAPVNTTMEVPTS